MADEPEAPDPLLDDIDLFVDRLRQGAFYLLVAGAGTVPDLDSILYEVYDQINTCVFPGGDDQWSLDEVGEGLSGHAASTPLLTEVLAEALRRRPPDGSEARKWNAAGKAGVQTRVAAVVEAQHRSAYGRVAHLVVGCAEAIAMAQGKAAGRAFVEEMRSRYPRHTAYKSELEREARGSALVGAGL